MGGVECPRDLEGSDAGALGGIIGEVSKLCHGAGHDNLS